MRGKQMDRQHVPKAFRTLSILPSAIRLPWPPLWPSPLYQPQGRPKRTGLLGGETLLFQRIQPNGQLSALNSHLRNPSPTKIRGRCHERVALKVNYMIVIINTDWFRMVRRLTIFPRPSMWCWQWCSLTCRARHVKCTFLWGLTGGCMRGRFGWYPTQVTRLYRYATTVKRVKELV